MLKPIAGKFKKILYGIGKTNKKLIRSGGLVPLRDFIISSPLIGLFDKYLKDHRNQLKIIYPISELLVNFILRISDGEKRIYHYRSSLNNYFYEAISSAKSVPHFNTLRYLLIRNKSLNKILSKILLFFCLIDLKIRIKKGELTQITLDADQTGRVIYGKQEGVTKGYFASSRGVAGYQIQVWSIRELKSLLKLELREGKEYSINGFHKDLRYLVRHLKKLGIPITVVADSGYEDKKVMAFLEDEGMHFLFVEKKRNTVKKRGKNAKNKLIIPEDGLIFKSGYVEKIIDDKEYRFREVFVYASKIFDMKGQFLFPEFYWQDFTNVFITNLELPAEEIYEFYKKHAQVETIIEELKNDFGMGYAYNETFDFNQSMTQIVGLTYNLKTFYTIAIKEFLRKKAIVKMSTLREELIHIPAMIVNECNRKVLKFSENGLKILAPIFKFFDYNVA